MTYKISLIRCLIHRAFKISSSCIIFHNKLTKIKILLQKNMYLNSVIDNQIKTFLDKQFTVDSGTTSEKQKTLHYSLPYIGHFSHVTKKKLRHICERFCKDIDIKIAFSSLKLSSFSVVRIPYLNFFSPMSFISLLVQDVKPVMLVRLSPI